MESLDVAVIGGGTAGPSAARIARARGMSVAVIERDRFGGDCLWWACVPTKALIECAKVFKQTRDSATFGTFADHVRADYHLVQDRKDAIIRDIAHNDDPANLEAEGIRTIRGDAAFMSPHEIRVGDNTIHAEHIVLAIGSRALIPAIPGLQEMDYLTNISAVSLRDLPQSVIILGAGPVGTEFAQLFARFGVQVTLLMKHARILAREEPEASAVAAEILKAEGVNVLTGAQTEQARIQDGKIMLDVDVNGKEQTVVGDNILVAAGRYIPLDGLHADAAGVKISEAGKIEIRATLQTNVPHIWTCGDASGTMNFTHVAENQGHHVGRNLGLDKPAPWDGRVVPRATFLEPEIAAVGLTEEMAAEESATLSPAWCPSPRATARSCWTRRRAS